VFSSHERSSIARRNLAHLQACGMSATPALRIFERDLHVPLLCLNDGITLTAAQAACSGGGERLSTLVHWASFGSAWIGVRIENARSALRGDCAPRSMRRDVQSVERAHAPRWRSARPPSRSPDTSGCDAVDGPSTGTLRPRLAIIGWSRESTIDLSVAKRNVCCHGKLRNQSGPVLRGRFGLLATRT
jgi:hypothetical protein